MCGITGCITYESNVSRTILKKMRDTLSHRGPDGAGLYISSDKNIGLAHRRLSIIEISEKAHQPMCSKDQNIWITYNGEIYNFKEIKAQLIKKGYSFRSESDTEVLIYAYQEYGMEMLNKLNGMFAFAIYDKLKNRLILARDRFGIKPLYYGFINNKTFLFASELKAIVQHPEFKKEISFGALGDFFKYRYIPAPRSIWNNVNKLAHGHYAILDIPEFELNIQQYYSLPEILREKTKSSLEEVDFFLNDAIKKTLVSDVEVGSFLSGGLDSSTISAIAKETQPSLKTFSIGFKPEKYSELSYSKSVASFLKIKHLTKTIDQVDHQFIKQLAYYYDEPHADSSNIPTYLLSELTSKHLKVSLSGDGGDEVFSGYNWYTQYLNKYEADSASNIIPNFETYYNKLLLNRFNDNLFEKCFTPEVYSKIQKENVNLFEQYICNDFKSVRAIQYIDMNTFMIDCVLTKVDRASMANSLETRIPLLDYRLVESVFSLPEDIFYSDSINKPILKKIMSGKIPDEVLTRDKKGFSAPVHNWQIQNHIKKHLPHSLLIQDNIINKTFITDLINNKFPNSSGMIWMIYIFDLWYQQWFKGIQLQ